MVYKTTQFIPFRYADPARIMFHGNMLEIVHDLFEEFIQAAGFTWKDWFEPKDWSCPIRHATVDYLAPFKAGETYDVAIGVSKISETSFSMKYVFTQGERKHGKVVMVHAFVDRKNFEKMQVPPKCRKVLEPYMMDHEA